MASRTPTVLLAKPRVEHHREPIGIGEPQPRLSFVVERAPAVWRQAAYEVAVRSPGGEWLASGRVDSGENVLVPWAGEPLRSRDRRQARIRVWGEGESQPSAWSPTVAIEAGLLSSKDWHARFISPDWSVDPSREQIAPLLRREFELRGTVVQARLYATALGLYEIEVNGRRIDDHAFSPGWSSYKHRLRYQTFDVTDALRPGMNALGAWLAEGWYAGRLGGHGGARCVYGDRIALMGQLEVIHSDGSRTTVVTDAAWRATPSPILRSGIYDGEAYDARRELSGWSTPLFDDRSWSPVMMVERDATTLVAPTGPPVRCIEERPVAEIVSADRHRVIVDFGQNLVGRCRIRVNGPRGVTVRLRHAEVLQDGELCLAPLREALATDEYTARGGDVEEWEPRFTYHGFRYAEISGWVDNFDPSCVVARIYHTDMERTGTFECSDERLSRLHENIVWSMRGNFVDVPTDCPQRDERVGWTGDLQVFAPTGAVLFDCSGMLDSWLRDLSADQKPNGAVPWIVPPIVATGARFTEADRAKPIAVWSDVAVLLPWTLYQRFADKDLLERQYGSAKAHIALVASLAGPDRVWDTGLQLGDWLDPTAPNGQPFSARANRYLVATAYFAHCSRVLAGMAAVLGNDEEATAYSLLAEEVATAFRRRYLLSSGRLTNEAQTSYALALRFGLIPSGPQREAAINRLRELVEENGFRIGTGFAGTPAILPSLSENGALDTAYSMLMNDSCPSWLYAVRQGATTIWERWDGLLPDGSINGHSMTSFNHYAFGSVGEWLYSTVAGLTPLEPGWRKIAIRPRPGGGLTSASATVHTPYGQVGVSWRLASASLAVEALVPIGTRAVVELPGTSPLEVGHGRHKFASSF